MGHGLAFRLLRQSLFRTFALSQIACHSLNAYRFPVMVDESSAYFQSDSTSLFRNNLEFVDGWGLVVSFPDYHLLGNGHVFRRQDVNDIHPQSLLAEITGDLLATPVE